MTAIYDRNWKNRMTLLSEGEDLKDLAPYQVKHHSNSSSCTI